MNAPSCCFLDPDVGVAGPNRDVGAASDTGADLQALLNGADSLSSSALVMQQQQVRICRSAITQLQVGDGSRRILNHLATMR